MKTQLRHRAHKNILKHNIQVTGASNTKKVILIKQQIKIKTQIDEIIQFIKWMVFVIIMGFSNYKIDIEQFKRFNKDSAPNG